MGRNVLPDDIPKSGERYNLTLSTVGKNKDGNFVARWIIDNGEYRGKIVSGIIDEQRAIDLKGEEKKLRRSAVLTVFGLAKIGGIWGDFDPLSGAPEFATKLAYRYALNDFLYAEGESEIADIFNRRKKAFTRK